MTSGEDGNFTLKEFKIEVTYNCALNCIHCSSDAHPGNKLEMTWDDCRNVINQATQLGAKAIAFSGGEPFQWPFILDAVELAVHLGLDVTVYTSGTTQEFSTVAERMRAIGVKKLVFSLFGGSTASHERITRVSGSFDRTIASLVETKRIGLEAEIHFVPMSTNYRELREVALVGARVGVSEISVLRLVLQGRASMLHSRILNRVQNLDLRRQIQRLREEGFHIRTGSPYNFLMVNAEPECKAGIDRLIIGPDMRVYPCDAFKQVKAEELVGTLDYSSLSVSSLKECWEKSPFLKAVRDHLCSDHEEPCNTCENISACQSGCLAQKAIAYGSLDKNPDPDCLRSKTGRIHQS
jgi:radical SAM protein with 4Fe4S-binding SPASM domain